MSGRKDFHIINLYESQPFRNGNARLPRLLAEPTLGRVKCPPHHH